MRSILIGITAVIVAGCAVEKPISSLAEGETANLLGSSIDWSDNVTQDLKALVGLNDKEWASPMDVSSDGNTMSFWVSPGERYVWTKGVLWKLDGAYEFVNSAGTVVSHDGKVWRSGKETQLTGPCGELPQMHYISEDGIIAGGALRAPECTTVGPALWVNSTYQDAWPTELDLDRLLQDFNHRCTGNFEAISDRGVAAGSIVCEGQDDSGWKSKTWGVVNIDGTTKVLDGDFPKDTTYDVCAAGDDGTVLIGSGYLWKEGQYVSIHDLQNMSPRFQMSCGGAHGRGADGSLVGRTLLDDGQSIGAIWKDAEYREYPVFSDIIYMNTSGAIIGMAQMPQMASLRTASASSTGQSASAGEVGWAILRPITPAERLNRLCTFAKELAVSGIFRRGQESSLCTRLQAAIRLLASQNVTGARGTVTAVLREVEGMTRGLRFPADVVERFRTEVQKFLVATD